MWRCGNKRWQEKDKEKQKIGHNCNSIDFNPGGMIWAPNGQNRFQNKGSFEHLKSGLLSRTLYKVYIFLNEVMKWLAYLGEIFDKVLIEIGTPNETPEFFELCGWCPIFDGFYFD
jgi:hypothetical protein